jgi:hypothetical protein
MMDDVHSVSQPPTRVPTGLVKPLELLELNSVEKKIGTLHKVEQQ